MTAASSTGSLEGVSAQIRTTSKPRLAVKAWAESRAFSRRTASSPREEARATRCSLLVTRKGDSMKIAKTTAHTLRVPYQFPLIKETQHALVTFVEIETGDGLKGHAFSAYPLRFSISDFINREAAPAIAGMDPLRPEAVRTTLYWKLSNKHYMGTWSCAASMIDVALWDIKGKSLKQPIW